MQQTEYQKLDDPGFLAERARVRELLEHMPDQSADREPLAALYADLTAEFDQRASFAWAGIMSDREDRCRESEP